MRMYNSHDDSLTWLSPPNDPAPRLMIDKGNGVGRRSLTSSQLPRTEDTSLHVKVEGGSKLTTPPKPTKKEHTQKGTRHSYKEYKYDDPEEDTATTHNNINNSRYSDSPDPSTDSLLTSLAPYFENEEALRGLDRETIRQLLQDHPELAEAAREFEKSRVIKKKNKNKESLSSRTTKSKKKRFNSSKNQDRYDESSSTAHHRSHLDGSSHIDAMMEAGVPIKSWFIVCLLIGAGAYQLRKIICQPSNNKRNSRKKGKNHHRETITTQRNLSINKTKSKHSKTHQKKKVPMKKNQNKNNINKAKLTKEVADSHVTKSGMVSQSTQNIPKVNASYQHTKTPSNEHNSRAKSGLIKTTDSENKTVTTEHVDEQNGTHAQKHSTVENHTRDDAESEQQVSQLKKITREVHTAPFHLKSADDGVTTSNETFQNESLLDYCEEDMNAIIDAMNDASSLSSSNGEWKVAVRRCKKRRNQQNKTKVPSTIEKTREHHPSHKVTEESSKNDTPKILSTNSNIKGASSVANEAFESTKTEINLTVSKNEDCQVPPYDTKPRNIKHDKPPAMTNMALQKGNKCESVQGTSKMGVNEFHEGTMDDEHVHVSDLQDDAALALKLQREEESRFENVNKVDEEWEIVKTKKQKKTSTIKDAK